MNFTLDFPAAWTGYSLDGAANVTLTGNTTLAGLSFGAHRLSVYANDTLGNMGKTEVAFEVKQETPQLGITEATLGLLSISLIAIAVLVLKKRKKPIKGAVYSEL